MSAPVMEPSACTWCGIAQRGHGRQYADAVGWHGWDQPSQEQILARMKARRLHLAVAKCGALPVPVGREPGARSVLDRARDALGARMSKDDLRLVLENTIAYAAGLEAERHSTNEALDDAVQALRADRDRIADLERTIAEAPASYALMERARAEADEAAGECLLEGDDLKRAVRGHLFGGGS